MLCFNPSKWKCHLVGSIYMSSNLNSVWVFKATDTTKILFDVTADKPALSVKKILLKGRV